MYSISVRAAVPGLHHWPAAPERRGYLRDLHRHNFEISVTLVLTDPDRQIEFHDLGETAGELFCELGSPYHPETTLLSFGAQSCETLAAKLGARLAHWYKLDPGPGELIVTVSEDGENDGTWVND